MFLNHHKHIKGCQPWIRNQTPRLRDVLILMKTSVLPYKVGYIAPKPHASIKTNLCDNLPTTLTSIIQTNFIYIALFIQLKSSIKLLLWLKIKVLVTTLAVYCAILPELHQQMISLYCSTGSNRNHPPPSVVGYIWESCEKPQHHVFILSDWKTATKNCYIFFCLKNMKCLSNYKTSCQLLLSLD